MKAVSHLIHQICELNPSAYPSDIQRSLQAYKNKTILALKIAFLVIYSFFLLMAPTPVTIYQILIALHTVFNLGVFLLTCRSYLHIFKITYTLSLAFLGPFLLLIDKNAVFMNWTVTAIIPVYTLFMTDSKACFMISGLIQLGSIHLFCKQFMVELINSMPTEQFVHKFSYLKSLSVIVNILCVYMLNRTNIEQIKRIYEAEKSKFEKQKLFLLSFSHEIRNLINSMTGNIEIAISENSNHKISSYLQNASVCSEVLLHLINNILDSGKVEVGELEITPTNSRIYDSFKKIWNVCSELIKRRSLVGSLTISKTIPKNLVIDSYRLTQIILNLVSNAIKFTHRGTIEVAVDWIDGKDLVDEECFLPEPFAEDEGVYEKNSACARLSGKAEILGVETKTYKTSRIGVSTGNSYGILKVSVTDTGIGISKEGLKKLFEKFTQVSSDTHSRKLGAGLGLFISKTLCLRMGGDLRAYSKQGVGSSFIVCIPADVINNPSQPGIDTVGVGEILAQRELKAMVVDDEDFNIMVISNFLTKMSIGVAEVAKDGADAVKKYIQLCNQGRQPNIVTMDIYMPVMDGKTAAKKIREYEKVHHLNPCLLLVISGNCSVSEIHDCTNKNGEIAADAFLKKPVTMEELSRVVRTCVAQ